MTTITRTSVPEFEKIVEHWVEHADELPNLAAHWIGWDEPFCFACGWLAPVPDGPDAWTTARSWFDRAHLQDRWTGHDNRPSNIVPLCHECHDSMPMFEDRDAALAWVNDHEPKDILWQVFTDRQLWGRSAPSRDTTMLRARVNLQRFLLETGGGRR